MLSMAQVSRSDILRRIEEDRERVRSSVCQHVAAQALKRKQLETPTNVLLTCAGL